MVASILLKLHILFERNIYPKNIKVVAPKNAVDQIRTLSLYLTCFSQHIMAQVLIP